MMPEQRARLAVVLYLWTVLGSGAAIYLRYGGWLLALFCLGAGAAAIGAIGFCVYVVALDYSNR